jgi:flagellar biosynthesis protein FlhG
MVDARLDREDDFVLPMINGSDRIILVEGTKNSIKDAYTLIKQLASRFGRIPFGVLVSGNDEKQSQTIFRNLEKTASEHVGLQLYFKGHVPADDYMLRAASLGRSVIDAYPRALSSNAFRRIAGAFAETKTSMQTLYEMAGA